ncbi:MAG: DNA-directed RNA polymerase subunit beta [Parcubacteria group bacterium GW2011_GWA2_47_8]|nr:MAG: DNA-directed RNA polymerase subunit beta [Parcubacteria group bacterium GW2011_GWA2_47_8]
MPLISTPLADYGRLCPIQTPEGPNIGLVVHLAIFSRINENGFLETPYFKVKNGKVTDEIVYLNAFDEQIAKIAHGGLTLNDDGSFENEEVEGRFHGTATTFPAKEVEYRDIAPQQTISVATALIPFLEHDDANRALMGSNMQRQAVPCIKPEAPIVSTGMEEAAAKDSGYAVVAEQSGIVAEADGRHIVVKDDKGKKIKYELINFVRSNQYSSLHQKPIVMPGDTIKKGQVIADGPAIDNGVLALGQNLLVAFMSWYGFNYEDAIVISERLVKNDTFSSIHIEDFTIDVRDTKLGPEITTYDIPNVSESKLSNLDEHGIIRPGAEVKEGDILVGKISPKGETDLTGEERLLRAVFGEKARDVRDTSLVVPHGKRGRVIGVKVFSREKGDRLQAGVIKSIQVEIARLRKISVGDKLAGRHGNKGVISRILPLEDMPHLADGRPVDIVLNPLGVASRMNIGQILEMHLGYAAQTQDYRAITPALAGATEEEIGEELERAGLPRSGKTILFDGLTGEPFDQEVAVGVIYMLKLNHLVEDKVHARSIGPYSLTTQQPLGGKAQFGGQRFGEMEVWALEGYGAAHTLQEMLTIKSDDVSGRARAYESITKSEPIRKPNVPASFNVLLSEMKGLGFNPEMLGAKMVDEDKNDE